MPQNPRRSVLFLIADDWSPLARCYGNEAIKTPRIDAFAQQSVVFDHAFCTSPSCAVSRACILTGRHSHTHGQYGHCHGFQGFSTHAHMDSTPLVLSRAGYATACIGKKHVEPAAVYPFAYEPKVNSRNGLEMAAAAGAFWQQNPDRPFYMHVGFSDPHRSPGGFGNERSYKGIPETTYGPDEVVVPDFLPDLPEVRADLAGYYQAVSRFDHGIGLLLDALEASGRAEETLVIVTTDHGMPFPGAKASRFDSGHHCPFILRTPDLPRGGIHNQALINWTNIRPTVQDWCQIPPPEDLPERSLLPILADPAPTGWDETYFSHCFHEVVDYNPYRVLRGKRYKFVQNLAPDQPVPLPTDLFRSPTWSAARTQQLSHMGVRPIDRVQRGAPEELFDLATDPQEADNRIGDPALAGVATSMRQQLYSFRKATKDPWLEVDFQAGRIGADQL